MADYTDEERELLISLGIAPEELDQLQGEQDHADKLREQIADPTLVAGRMVVPNYGGIIAAAVNNIRGNKENTRIKGEREGVLARVLRGRNLWDRPDRMAAQTAPIAEQNQQNLMATPAPQIPAGALSSPGPAPGPAPGSAPPQPAVPRPAPPAGPGPALDPNILQALIAKLRGSHGASGSW